MRHRIGALLNEPWGPPVIAGSEGSWQRPGSSSSPGVIETLLPFIRRYRVALPRAMALPMTSPATLVVARVARNHRRSTPLPPFDDSSMPPGQPLAHA